jgi:hypothetical protein
MASIGIILTEEEKRAILDKYPEPPRRKPPQPKPKPALVATVSEKFAEAARTNPGNVRLSVTAKDETVVVERPRRTEVLEVLAVDVEGRPAKARRYDTLTGEWGVVDFEKGYRQPSGAVHSYDPLSALQREDD